MRNSAKACLALAALTTLSGLNVLRTRPAGEIEFGHIVGIFLIPVILLVAGLKLAQKPQE